MSLRVFAMQASFVTKIGAMEEDGEDRRISNAGKEKEI
jgi:hypothetical protein